ncbi:MAG: hypothetical protein ACI4EU_05925 [Butyrivibrio sp.]
MSGSKDLMSQVREITNGLVIPDATIAKWAQSDLRQANSEIKSNVHFKSITGDYVRALSVRKTENGAVWYAKAPQYRLTHLLEKGHKIKKKGDVVGYARAFPHIKAPEEAAVARFEKRFEDYYKLG